MFFKKKILLTILYILIYSVFTGVFLKIQQLTFVSGEIIKYYPIRYYIDFIFLRFLSSAILLLINAVFIGWVYKLNYLETLYSLSKLYLLLIFSFSFGYMHSFYLFPLLLIMVNLIFLTKKLGSFPSIYCLIPNDIKKDIGCLFIILIFYLFVFIPLVDPRISFYDVTKLYLEENRFQIGSVIPAATSLQEPAWYPNISMGGVPLAIGSQGCDYLLTLIYEIFPISMSDLSSIQYVQKMLLFLIFIYGAFGFYFFIRYGMKLSHSTALFAGIIFVLNHAILSRFGEIIWGYIICLMPLPLLFLVKGVDSKNIWNYAISGILVGLGSFAHFNHPENFIGTVYFFLLFLIWNLISNMGNSEYIKCHTKGLLLFFSSILLVNYRTLAFIFDYYANGNRTFFADAGTTAFDVVEQIPLIYSDVLSIFGFTKIGGTYNSFFGSILLTVFTLVGIYVYMNRKRIEAVNTENSFISFCIAGMLILPAFLSYPMMFVWGFLGVPGQPPHSIVKYFTPLYLAVISLAAFGVEHIFKITDNKNDRRLLLASILGYLIFLLFIYHASSKYSLDSIDFQIAITIVSLISAIYMIDNYNLKKAVIVISTIFLSIVTLLPNQPNQLYDFMIGKKYFQNIGRNLNLHHKHVQNNIINRIMHPEYFSYMIYPANLSVVLDTANKNIENPRTKYFLYKFLVNYKNWLSKKLKLIKDAKFTQDAYAADAGYFEPILSRVDNILESINNNYQNINKSTIKQIKTLTLDYSRVVVGDAELFPISSWLIENIPSDSYFRLGFSAKGPTDDNFADRITVLLPQIESTYYNFQQAATQRWYSILDYYNDDIERILNSNYYYGANMFPPPSNKMADILNIQYAMAKPEDFVAYPYLEQWEKITSPYDYQPIFDTNPDEKKSQYTLIKNPTVIPRASIYYNAKTAKPIKNNLYNLYSMERVKYGRKLLEDINHQQMLLIETDSPDIGIKSEYPRNDNVEIINILGNFAVFKINNQRPGLLFYSDMYHKDWHAFVDSKEAKIYRSNLSFKSFLVPKDKHIVWLEFRSNVLFYFKALALTIMILTVLFYMKTEVDILKIKSD